VVGISSAKSWTGESNGDRLLFRSEAGRGRARLGDAPHSTYKEVAMKRREYWLAVMAGVLLVGVVGCGQEASKTSAPAAPSKSVTDSAGQAIVDSIKTPLDKARAVEGTLEKAADKTADTIKDATP
jgi:hypothetical protein